MNRNWRALPNRELPSQNRTTFDFWIYPNNSHPALPGKQLFTNWHNWKLTEWRRCYLKQPSALLPRPRWSPVVASTPPVPRCHLHSIIPKDPEATFLSTPWQSSSWWGIGCLWQLDLVSLWCIEKRPEMCCWPLYRGSIWHCGLANVQKQVERSRYWRRPMDS